MSNEERRVVLRCSFFIAHCSFFILPCCSLAFLSTGAKGEGLERPVSMEGELAKIVGGRIRQPLAIVLGSPREAADHAAEVGGGDVVCYQMDLYQADRLREELDRRGVAARVVTAADLWDLPADFQTVVYPAPERGERILKIDMIEQAYHVLRPRGTFVVVSPYEKESFFPAALKKVFGRVHTPEAGKGTVFW